ncbi:MAG: hypothetical protein JNK72_07985 [Myxococcales bacterium]|nr:hypothetical protein [Myxococcales bacterium]
MVATIRMFLAGVFALTLLLAGSTAEASHFRFGTITWVVPDPVRAPRTVRFTVTHAWREGAQNSISLNFGDNTTSAATLGTLIGSGGDVANTRYSVYQFTVDKTYTSDGPFTVFFSSCCWISGLQGSPSSFRVESRVALGGGNTGGPVTTSPAIITLSSGATRTYFIPIFDPDLDPATCRFATANESSITQPIPTVPSGGARPTLMPVPGGCVMTWDLSMAMNGERYVLPFVGESTHAGVASIAALQVIIEISGSAPPACAGTGTFTAPVGQPFSATVTGTNPGGGNLEMSVTNQPAGSTFTPPAGTRVSPFQTTFAWTPTMQFFGTTQIVLVNYRNTAGLTATCFLTIQVPSCNDFGQSCTVGVGACARTGQRVCTSPGQSACNVTAGTPGTETCNGVDDNCDGTVDNGSLCSGGTPFCDSGLRRCVACRTGTDCTPSAPVCDVSTRVCRLCNVDMECGGSTPACATARGCVQCTGTNRTACTGSTSVCNTTSNRCVQCLSNTDCGGATPICDLSNNTCRACRADNDCSGSTPACALSGSNIGRCVQCTPDNRMQCTGMSTVCNPETNRCVSCNSDNDCSGTTPVCELSSRTCRACMADNECRVPTSPACKRSGTNAGACVPCTEMNSTACSGMTPVCNLDQNRCVQCLSNTQCSGATPICDRNVCRGCSSNNDCSGSTPACATDGRCVQCTEMSAMACAGATPVCNATANRCVECLTNTQCSGRTPVCQNNACRACAGDMECSAREGATACAASGDNAGACVQCTTSNAMACVSPTSVCNDTNNRCVQCTSNSNCSGNAPVCDNAMCRGCRDDSECAMRDGTSACSINGACVQCTPMNTRACTGDTSVCDPTSFTCKVCTVGPMGDATRCAMNADGQLCVRDMSNMQERCGCASDSDCGGASSGRICNAMTQRCEAGCAVGEGRNGCPMGQSCTASEAGTTGMCTMNCNRNADCAAPTPVCRVVAGAMNACVECLTDTECTGRSDGRTRCIGPNNTCAQCSEENRSACEGNMSGAACVMGLCGCTADSDCGGASSGRICNAMTRTCVAGCSPATGRNGCPTGQSCTSSDPETPGVCTTSCNRDADCMMPRPYCLNAGGDAGVGDASVGDGGVDNSRLCVECVTDTQCANRTDGRVLCARENNSCAACSPGRTDNCSRERDGVACLSNGLCGCLADSDCAATLRCDTQANRCVPRPMTNNDAGVDAGNPGLDAGSTTSRLTVGGSGCACRVGSAPTGATPRSGALGTLVMLAGAMLARRRRKAA